MVIIMTLGYEQIVAPSMSMSAKGPESVVTLPSELLIRAVSVEPDTESELARVVPSAPTRDQLAIAGEEAADVPLRAKIVSSASAAINIRDISRAIARKPVNPRV